MKTSSLSVHAALADAMRKQAVQAGAQAPTVRGADWRTGLVTTVNTDGTVVVDSVVTARRLDTYLNATVGDKVVITQSGNGNWAALGRTAPVVDNEWTSWTPSVSGGGSATFSTLDGWYKRLGIAVFVEVYVVPSAVGSGSSNVTFTLPSTPYRGSANRRQSLPCHVGTIGSCIGLVTAGGSGANVDAVVTSTGSNLLGSQLTTSTIITVTAYYREV